MLLTEIISLGDDNVLGRLINDSNINLHKLTRSQNKETKKLANSLLGVLNSLEQDPTVTREDGYSLLNYLRMLTKTDIDNHTLRAVSDALGSYDNESGE